MSEVDDGAWLDKYGCQYCCNTARSLKEDGELGRAEDGTPWCVACDSELGTVGNGDADEDGDEQAK